MFITLFGWSLECNQWATKEYDYVRLEYNNWKSEYLCTTLGKQKLSTQCVIHGELVQDWNVSGIKYSNGVESSVKTIASAKVTKYQEGLKCYFISSCGRIVATGTVESIKKIRSDMIQQLTCVQAYEFDTVDGSNLTILTGLLNLNNWDTKSVYQNLYGAVEVFLKSQLEIHKQTIDNTAVAESLSMEKLINKRISKSYLKKYQQFISIEDVSTNNEMLQPISVIYGMETPIQEMTLKCKLDRSSKSDTNAPSCPSISQIEECFQQMSVHQIIHKLTHYKTSVLASLCSIKDLAQSYVLGQQNAILFYDITQSLKSTIFKLIAYLHSMVELFIVRFGIKSFQHLLIKSIIIELDHFHRKNRLRNNTGFIKKNIEYNLEHVMVLIDKSIYLFEDISHHEFNDFYLNPQFFRMITYSITLLNSMINQFISFNKSKEFFSKVWPIICNNGFIFIIYLPSNTTINLDIFQLFKSIKITFHNQLDLNHIKIFKENHDWILSIPMEQPIFKKLILKMNEMIRIIPIALIYQVNNEPLNDQVSKLSHTSLKILQEYTDTISKKIYISCDLLFKLKECIQELKLGCINVGKIVEILRLLQNHISDTGMSIFGNFWGYHTGVSGVFTLNELEFLGNDGKILITE
ncbi:hypothetical protein BC833DRAFT_620085 [Globomyces pollinis-pini]|nr:hypothetical protein BC833DRAFT_620085 [Globomyces pollinis-pini]